MTIIISKTENPEQYVLMRRACELLLEWKDENYSRLESKRDGICFNLEFHFSIFDYHRHIEPIIKELFLKWPSCSGFKRFPVPSPKKRINAYQYFRQTKDKWVGEYGRLRRELCGFIVDNVEFKCS